MRLGLLGGTFDPIHTGHLLIAESARHALSLDQIIFIPAGDPPHKGETVTPAEHRYAMVLLATGTNPTFTVSRREIERSGPSYSLTTIREFRAEAGSESELFFVVGADTLRDIRTWYRWEEVLRECRFLVVARPGVPFTVEQSGLPQALRRQVDLVISPGLEISSTEIRDRVREGKPIRYLVPEPVEQYIVKHGLYRSAPAAASRALSERANT
jgi:nicotinate-nucleotide adenylyltransferase